MLHLLAKNKRLFDVSFLTRRESCIPSICAWVNKLQSVPTVEYNSTTMKRSKLLIHVTWRNVKCILLSERSQTPKAT